MDVKYYTFIIFMVIFGLAIMDVIICSSSYLEKSVKRRFLIIYSLAMLDALAEWLGVVLNGASPELRTLHLAVKCFELSTAPIILLYCSVIMDVKNMSKKMYVVHALYAVHIILEMISMKTGLIFYVDENNVYHHGDMYFIYYIALAAGMLLMLAEAFETNKKYQGQDSHIMILSVILFVAGLAVQGIDSSLKTDWVSAAIFGFLFFIYYSDLVQKIDTTTTLLDKLCFEDFKSKHHRRAVIVLIDIDKFKQVNDNYGHLYGDCALKAVGETVKSVFSRYGYCFRIGGDEMCAVLVRRTKNVDELCAAVNEKLDKLREEDEKLPSISAGYSVLEPGGKFDDVFADADTKMYVIKNSKKASNLELSVQR